MADLRALTTLPETPLGSLWQVLGPMVGDSIPGEAERLLEVFAAAHRVDELLLARGLKACRFLLREAAAADISADEFARDMALIVPERDGERLKGVLLGHYGVVVRELRAEVLRGTLADHGRLLVGVDWRIDSIGVSNRGARLAQPVGLLTLRYRNGSEARRITLQALPDLLRELRDACDRMLA